LPQFDPQLYGECQAALLNLESLLVAEFGQKYALLEQLAVSLQFSQAAPEERQKATKALARSAVKTVANYIETFRGALDSQILNSMKYSYSVFLVPRVANRKSAADVAVQFVKVDEASPEELERLEKLNILIRDKHIPISNVGLMKPGEVVKEVAGRITQPMNIGVHTTAWRCYGVRPATGAAHPERTLPEYCIYDQTHEDYVYTKAWVEKLVRDLSDPTEYQRVTRRPTQAPAGT
jgi:hypothetical protein